jgi:hypothetical protein
MEVVQRDIGSENGKLSRDIELGAKWSIEVHTDLTLLTFIRWEKIS